MKQTPATLLIFGVVVFILAFTKFEDKSVGAIGDVKYSVLPPDKFQEQNGKGWVLMDDKVPLQGSDLGNLGITSIPDARGLFIRALNLKRADDKADLYTNENNGQQRQMGDYQDDAIKSHYHIYNDAYFIEYGGNKRGSKSGHDEDNNFWWRDEGGSTDLKTKNNDPYLRGETRPKNIALYTYIKLND